MSQAKNGDTVRVHYTGKLDDGTEFDSSAGNSPLEFTLGEGSVIPGFEEAVIGMNTGDAKEIKILEADAYGPRRDELVIDVDRADLPEELDPKVGDELELQQGESEAFSVRVTEASDQSITMDANHPLAGHTLNFNIELVKIV